MTEHIAEVTDATFDQAVRQSSTPVLVDFWAEWCGPCRAMAPILEQVAGDAGDRFKIMKMNVDKNGKIPPQFGIQSIPTMILFERGKAVGRQVGAVPATRVKDFIGRHLAA
ncbi:MAG TPA: thioredoxin [Nevskiaceae bacterium]|nr:thioredoxin [Nevskiaceae bacterium]